MSHPTDIVVLYPCDISHPNGVGIVFSTGRYPIEDVAHACVPAGKPYKFMPKADIPDDEYRDAWEADFTEHDGISIGYEAWMAQR